MTQKIDYERELNDLHIIYDFQMDKLNQISNMIENHKKNNEKELLKLGNKWLKQNNIKIKNGGSKL